MNHENEIQWLQECIDACNERIEKEEKEIDRLINIKAKLKAEQITKQIIEEVIG